MQYVDTTPLSRFAGLFLQQKLVLQQRGKARDYNDATVHEYHAFENRKRR